MSENTPTSDQRLAHRKGGDMTPRERLGQELYDLSDTVYIDDLTEQELAGIVALFRQAYDRVTPANVIYLKPRAVRSRKRVRGASPGAP
jgi:hypothetical protein